MLRFFILSVNDNKLGDDQFALLFREDCLQVEDSDIENLLGDLSFGDVALRDSELHLTASRLKIEFYK